MELMGVHLIFLALTNLSLRGLYMGRDKPKFKEMRNH